MYNRFHAAIANTTSHKASADSRTRVEIWYLLVTLITFAGSYQRSTTSAGFLFLEGVYLSRDKNAQDHTKKFLVPYERIQ
ncbi:MAG: hypothetical protein RL150_56 [Candidatus Parcubacteria bacterium]|jgi:hypothetical protein